MGTSLRSLLIAALVALLPAATGAQAPAPELKTFTLRLPGEPETLDWNRAHTLVETYVLMNIMEGLITFDSSLKVQPALAEKWTVSKDGRTYTFKIRPSVKWTDGVPLRAKDFVYSWRRLLQPTTAAAYAYFLFDVEGAEDFNRGRIKDFSQVGVKALDDMTFQVRLTRPVAHWIYIPTFWVTFPLREDVVEKHGSAWATPGRMVTIGPYTLAAHDHDQRVVLKANPTYHSLRGNIDQIVGLIIKDDSSALSLYETGKLDFLTDIASTDLKRLAGRRDLKTFPYFKTMYLGFVHTKYPVSSPHVRRAVAMAIDKSKIGEILHGAQQPATSFIPPRMMAHTDRVGLPFNPARARAELATSGVDVTRPVELLLPNWDKNLLLSQFIQAELKKNLGITVALQPFDNKTYRAQIDLRTFPLFEISWSADYPDPDNYMSVFLGDSGNNRTSWKSKKYDDLILRARAMREQRPREKAYIEAQRLLLDEHAVIVPLYYEPNVALIRPRVQGIEINPLNYLFLRKVSLAP
jgi:oligopeptide transport system substrate-binding protein